MYIASCSFGKDSLATILLALKHNEPLDRVVFAEVMYDHQRGISGEIPEHIEWIYGTAIPRLKSMGVHVDVVRDKDDYRHFFCSAVGGGKFAGLLYGFPIGGKCVINRNCKLRPIHQYYKQIGGVKLPSMSALLPMSRNAWHASNPTRCRLWQSMALPKQWQWRCAARQDCSHRFMIPALVAVAGFVLTRVSTHSVCFARPTMTSGKNSSNSARLPTSAPMVLSTAPPSINSNNGFVMKSCN